MCLIRIVEADLVDESGRFELARHGYATWRLKTRCPFQLGGTRQPPDDPLSILLFAHHRPSSASEYRVAPMCR